VNRRIEWTKKAGKDLARLDSTTRQRVFAGIKRLSGESQGDVRRLQGLPEGELFRLRIGDWRIIFSYTEDLALLIHRVRPRGDAYKD
jgi:mRNA interferase RelE/StbE